MSQQVHWSNTSSYTSTCINFINIHEILPHHHKCYIQYILQDLLSKPLPQLTSKKLAPGHWLNKAKVWVIFMRQQIYFQILIHNYSIMFLVLAACNFALTSTTIYATPAIMRPFTQSLHSSKLLYYAMCQLLSCFLIIAQFFYQLEFLNKKVSTLFFICEDCERGSCGDCIGGAGADSPGCNGLAIQHPAWTPLK